MLRQRPDLSPQDIQFLDHVKQYGLEVVSIFEDERGPGFAFSVGLYDVYNHPEILIIGLPQEVAHRVLNNLADDIKKGKHYTSEISYAGILKNHQCQFKTIDTQHYREYLGFAMWYYGGENFPALQCVWPDKNQLFPWDKKFDKKLQWYQPVLA